jgi:hypothetical protein
MFLPFLEFDPLLNCDQARYRRDRCAKHNQSRAGGGYDRGSNRPRSERLGLDLAGSDRQHQDYLSERLYRCGIWC